MEQYPRACGYECDSNTNEPPYNIKPIQCCCLHNNIFLTVNDVDSDKESIIFARVGNTKGKNKEEQKSHSLFVTIIAM